MTAIVVLASLKGGTGKTTVALNLAVAAECAGIRTVVIDLDPQQASAKWGDLRRQTVGPPLVISAMAARLPQALDKAARLGARLVVMDTAAHAEGILLPAIDRADLVLIPCRPAIVDLQHLATTMHYAAARAKPAAVVLNAVQARANDWSDARAALWHRGITVFPVMVSNLVAYPRAITVGQGVAEYEPDGKAAAEMHALLEQVID